MYDGAAWRVEGYGTRRLVWSVQVHAHFQEKHHIYLISGKNPDASDTFSARFRKMFRRLQIDSANVNAVYGEHDIVLTFWATQATRQRFLRGIVASGLQVDDIVEFISDQVVRIGSPDRITDLDVEKRRDVIQRAARVAHLQDGANDAEADSELVEDLIRRGFIQIRESPVGVKFMMFLRHEAKRPRHPASAVFEEMQIEAAQLDLTGIVLHEGSGYWEYVIEGVAPSFDQMLPAVNRLRTRAKKMYLDPWTLPLADYSFAPMADSIDAVSNDLSDTLEGFLQQLEPEEVSLEVRRELSSMEADDRRSLSRLVEEVRADISDLDLRLRFYEVLQAILLKDRKMLNRSLSFLTSIENDLRTYVPRTLQSHLGNDWLKRLRTVLDSDAKAMSARMEGSYLEKDFGDWSLYMLLYSLSVAYREFPQEVASVTHARLPDGWRNRIRDVVNVRDQFAHGKIAKLTSPRTQVDETLEKTLRDVAFALKFQDALEQEVG